MYNPEIVFKGINFEFICKRFLHKYSQKHIISKYTWTSLFVLSIIKAYL